MKKILIITILFIPLAYPSDKQLTCPHFSDDIKGLLKDSAWRIDKFTFSTKDFTKDEPYLTHHIRVKYKSSEDAIASEIEEICRSVGCTEKKKEEYMNEWIGIVNPDTEKTSMSKFIVSPTHINISNSDGNIFSINRSNLNLTWNTSGGIRESQCKIEDIKTPDNNIF